MNTRRWYAIRIQTRLGNTASAVLRGKGFEEFLPLYQSRRQWSDRVKEIGVPLFPGYLFCRFDVEQGTLPILSTPGVIGVVGAGKCPLPIEDHEIDAIRTVVGSGLVAQPWAYVAVGSRVRMEHGPLAGLEGIVTSIDKIYRLVVSVALLQRSVAVEIDRTWVRPIAPQMASLRVGPTRNASLLVN